MLMRVVLFELVLLTKAFELCIGFKCINIFKGNYLIWIHVLNLIFLLKSEFLFKLKVGHRQLKLYYMIKMNFIL